MWSRGRSPLGCTVRWPTTAGGSAAGRGVVTHNADLGVTWIHSYITADKAKTYCIYDGPSPEAIQQAAERNGLPVDHITPVSVLDPYVYQ